MVWCTWSGEHGLVNMVWWTWSGVHGLVTHGMVTHGLVYMVWWTQYGVDGLVTHGVVTHGMVNRRMVPGILCLLLFQSKRGACRRPLFFLSLLAIYASFFNWMDSGECETPVWNSKPVGIRQGGSLTALLFKRHCYSNKRRSQGCSLFTASVFEQEESTCISGCSAKNALLQCLGLTLLICKDPGNAHGSIFS